MSAYIIPFVIFSTVLYGITKKISVFDSFLTGAKEGIQASFSLLPVFLALSLSISMMHACGAENLISALLAVPAEKLHLPAEVIPLGFIHPISGSGALMILEELLQKFHPDSYIGKVASVLQSSSETTFYILTVYFSASSVQKTGKLLPCCLTGDLVCFLFSAFWVTMLL